MDTRTLIGELQSTLRQQLARMEELRALPLEQLQQPPVPGRWSVMETIAHMNLSSGHYHRHLQRLYANENNGLRFRTTFTPGFWGERLTRGMAPRPDRTIGWKMRTMAMFDPARSGKPSLTEGWQALDSFCAMCHGMIALLERSRTRGLEGEKVTSTLGLLLRFKAGDAFRFPVAHQQRHMLQIERTLEALQ